VSNETPSDTIDG